MDVSPFDRGNELPSVVVLPPVDITQIEVVDNDVAVSVRVQVGDE